MNFFNQLNVNTLENTDFIALLLTFPFDGGGGLGSPLHGRRVHGPGLPLPGGTAPTSLVGGSGLTVLEAVEIRQTRNKRKCVMCRL